MRHTATVRLSHALIRVGLAGLLLGVCAAPAMAQLPEYRHDATAWVGITMVPTALRTKGIAFGGGSQVFKWELEYAGTAAETVPAVGTIGFSLVVQPFQIRRMRFYGTAGDCFYGATDRGEASATTLGGGAKIALVGPLRLRLDYRAFFIRGGDNYDVPAHARSRRIYAGFNLGL